MPLLLEIEDIIEQLGMAVKPVLQQAIELGIYEECDPSQINAFKAMQQSQKLLLTLLYLKELSGGTSLFYSY